MRPTNRFTKGCAVYTCRLCKRATRQTGRGDNDNVRLCADCFDLAGIENAINDGAELGRYRAEALRLLAAIRAAGGVPSFEYEAALQLPPAAAVDLAEADNLVRDCVAGCESLDELLDKWPTHGYRPTLYVDEPHKARLADLYDARAIERGLTVAAYRCGRP